MMRPYLQAGAEGMPRFRRRLCLRSLGYLLGIITIAYLLLQHEEQARFVKAQPLPTAEHASHPVYEYTSMYRTHADLVFEELLDKQLLSIERKARNSLSYGNESLVADHTIWQIASAKEAKTWSAWKSQWWKANPEWSYQLYTSSPADFLETFNSIPDITTANKNYPSIKDDLLQYLLLWYHGGLYAEISTWNRIAMSDCPPIFSVLEGTNVVSLMIGVDHDEPYLTPNTLRSWGWTRNFGFGTTVLWAPKRFDPVLRKAIVRSISHARTHKVLIGNWRKYIQSLQSNSEISGSGMLTDIILEALSRNLAPNDSLRDRDAGLERRVTWKKFRKLKTPIWIEQQLAEDNMEDEIRGLAILPINIWASGQNHSDSGPPESADACVNRVYDWKLGRNLWDQTFG